MMGLKSSRVVPWLSRGPGSLAIAANVYRKINMLDLLHGGTSMLCDGTYLSRMSGKMGGVVHAHNKGGQYMRAGATPTNPNTVQQQVVRDAMQLLSTRWVDVLTLVQRTAWETYAANVPLSNRLGYSRNSPGLAMYCRSNISRIQASAAVVDAAPVVWDTGTFTAPAIVVAHAATTASVAFTTTDAWANEVGGYMFLYASRPQNPTINFFNGPYRYSGKISGAATPPTSPFTLTLPFVAGPAGSKVFFKAVASRADGRLASPFQSGSVCT